VLTEGSMTARKTIVLIGALLLPAGCATVPTGPSVMVLPGSGKNFEQFQADDGVCRRVRWRRREALQTKRCGQHRDRHDDRHGGWRRARGSYRCCRRWSGSAPPSARPLVSSAGRQLVPATPMAPASRCRAGMTSGTCNACTPRAIRFRSLSPGARERAAGASARRLPYRQGCRRRPPDRRRHPGPAR
jgi:hypothetical protein